MGSPFRVVIFFLLSPTAYSSRPCLEWENASLILPGAWFSRKPCDIADIDTTLLPNINHHLQYYQLSRDCQGFFSLIPKKPKIKDFRPKSFPQIHLNQTFSDRKLRIIPMAPSTCWQRGICVPLQGCCVISWGEAVKAEGRHPKKCGAKTNSQHKTILVLSNKPNHEYRTFTSLRRLKIHTSQQFQHFQPPNATIHEVGQNMEPTK